MRGPIDGQRSRCPFARLGRAEHPRRPVRVAAHGRRPVQFLLPPARGGKVVDSPISVFVQLSGDGRAFVDGKATEGLDALVDLAKNVRESDPNARAVVAADRTVPWGRVVQAIDRLKIGGIAKLAFAVQPEPPAATPCPVVHDHDETVEAPRPFRAYVINMRRSFLVGLILALLAVTGIAGASHVAAGRDVMIEWGGSWWRGSVLAELPRQRVVVHYEGWSDDHDEIVAVQRVAFEAPLPAKLRRGDAVLVEWNGSFWPATVRYVEGDGTGIRYDGYGPEWDEEVPRSRLTRIRH
ncbi:MAG: biopolymer transporter ExbD [Myxococcales bacterium]|nr:biopolymer transporter ExbD [Myxococcales bacterium]